MSRDRRSQSTLGDDVDDSTAVLLIAHGSRLKTANDDLVQLAEILREKSSYGVVEIAYLELVEPTVFQAARSCVRQGARRVLMLPYFLSAGQHVAADLARFRSDLTREFPDVRFTLCPPLGLHPAMITIVMDRLKEGSDE